MAGMPEEKGWPENLSMKDMSLVADEQLNFSNPDLVTYWDESIPMKGSSSPNSTDSSGSSFEASFSDEIQSAISVNIEAPPLASGDHKDNSSQQKEELVSQVLTENIEAPPLASGDHEDTSSQQKGELVSQVVTENRELSPVKVVTDTDNGGTQDKASKLQTPAFKLPTIFSPVRDSQLEYLKELRDADVTPFIPLPELLEAKCTLSDSQSSNDTYVVSQSGSEDRMSLNTSHASSEASLQAEPVRTKLKQPKPATSLPRPQALNSSRQIKRPLSKPSLLPSKPQSTRTAARGTFGQPASKYNAPNKSLPKPTNSKKSKLTLRNQENAGIPPVSRATARPSAVPKARTRKSSIPRPTSNSQLRKNPAPKVPSEVGAKILKSVSEPLIHSTPITDQPTKPPCTDQTPNRRRSSGGGSPRNITITKSKPTFSIKPSTETSEGSQSPPKASEVPKTPKTVTKKRRSLLPTPRGKDIAGSMEHKNRGAQASGSPHLPREKAAASSRQPVKKIFGPPRSRLAFKPRNGPMANPRRDGPLKPSLDATYLADESAMVPKTGASKVVHSPLNKEDSPATPHSKWSPIKRKKTAGLDDAYQCTKRTVK